MVLYCTKMLLILHIIIQPEEMGVHMLSTTQSSDALSNRSGIPVKYKLPVHMEWCLVTFHTAEEPSPCQLRRANTIDRPIGVQHQSVGMMNELTQKLAMKKLEEREEENNDRDWNYVGAEHSL